MVQPLQPMGIYSIPLGENSPEEMIKKLITPVLSEGNSDEPPYKEYPLVTPLVHNFSVRTFAQRKPTPNSFVNLLITSSEEARELQAYTIHIICFLYRKAQDGVQTHPDLFALTSHDGYRVLQGNCDYSFPLQVAKRIVDPSLLRVEAKPLAGEQESETSFYRKKYELGHHLLETAWKVFELVTSRFKEGSSIMRLSPFRELNQPTQVELTKNRVTIRHKMGLEGYAEVCDLFAKIIRREKTRKIVVEDEGTHSDDEEDSLEFSYLENIQRVPPKEAEKLDGALINLLWQLFRNPNSSHDLYFGHRVHRDYYRSSSFVFSFGKNEIPWHYPPSFGEVLKAMRDLYPQGTLENELDFIAAFNKTFFKFDGNKGWKHLREMIQGEFSIGTHTFFRIDGVWLQIRLDHLKAIQHDFSKLLDEHLIRPGRHEHGQLSRPWFTDTRSIAFALADIADPTLRDSVEKELSSYAEVKFSFVSKKGEVLVPYLTRVILQGCSNLSYRKTVTKNWAELEELLNKKYAAKEILTVDDLRPLLKEETKQTKGNTSQNTQLKDHQETDLDSQALSNDIQEADLETPAIPKDSQETVLKSHAETLFTELQKEYAVIEESGTTTKQAILNESGIPNVGNLEGIKFSITRVLPKRALEDEEFLKKLSDLLKKAFDEKRPVVQVDLENALIGIHYNFRNRNHIFQPKDANLTATAKDILEELMYPRVLPGMKNRRYVVRGPVDRVSDIKVKDFLTERLKEYRLIFEEEGYNRLFLSDTSYFVADQKYGDSEARVELFDLMAVKGTDLSPKLFLYHIKKGFGPKTREACGQLRVSANQIGGSRSYEENRVLRELYKTIVAGGKSAKGEKSIFSQKAQKQWSDFGTADDFVKLFQKSRESIYFVYAFVNSEGDRRKLAGELSGENQTIFRSVGAKVELLQLHRFLRSIGFQFAICQIENVSSLIAQEPITESNPMILPSLPSCNNTKNLLKYGKKHYVPEKTPLTITDLLASLMGLSVPSDHWSVALWLAKKLRDELRKSPLNPQLREYAKSLGPDPTKSTKKDPIASPLGQAMRTYEKRKRTQPIPSGTPINAFKAIMSIPPSERLNKLCHFLERDYYLMTTEHMKLFAFLLNERIVVVNEEGKEKIFHEPGESCRVLFFSKGRYHLCKEFQEGKTDEVAGNEDEESSSEAELQPASAKVSSDHFSQFSQHFSETDKDNILDDSRRIGITNKEHGYTKNNCFMIATLQLLQRTPLREFLRTETNLKSQDGKSVLEQLDGFFVRYAHESQQMTPDLDSLDVTCFRSFGSPPYARGSQEDAVDFFRALCNPYKMDEVSVNYQVARKIDLTRKIASEGNDISEPLKMGEDYFRLTEVQEPILQLTFSKEENRSCQVLLNEFLMRPEVGVNVKVKIEEKIYEVPVTETKKTIRNKIPFLFLQVNRFDTSGPRLKVETPFPENFRIFVGDQQFEVRGFVMHLGSTSKSGHYKTYFWDSEGWFMYDDDRVSPAPLSAATVLEEAKKNAYLVFATSLTVTSIDDHSTESASIPIKRMRTFSPEPGAKSKKTNIETPPSIPSDLLLDEEGVDDDGFQEMN